MAAVRYVSVCSAWRRGRVKSRAELVSAEAAGGGCLHELPASTQPLSGDTRQKVLQQHERGLAPGTSRCPLDALPALRRALRSRPLPVRVVSEPEGVLPGVLGCVQTLTVREVLQRLAKERPGDWQLYEEGATAPLAASQRLLRDALAAPAARVDAVVLRAALPAPPAGERAGRLAKRLRAAEALAAEGGGALEAEKEAARRGAAKLRRLLVAA